MPVEQTTMPTQCVGFCTAEAYQLSDLALSLKEQYKVTSYPGLIHAVYPEGPLDVFYFGFGVVVCWDIPKGSDVRILEEVKRFEINSIKSLESERFNFSYGDSSIVQRDRIVLQPGALLHKMAISYAIAQSLKLTIFESTIDNTIRKSGYLAEDLAKRGEIRLSRKHISQRIGDIFIKRNSVNLHSDILDTPEFLWEHDEIEPLYDSASHYLDIKKRADVLNKRMDIVKELLEMLADELKHKHQSVLEWVIIWLILAEVVVSVTLHFLQN